MYNIHLICLGKLKESYWREAEAEYLKRLQTWVKVEIHEIKEETLISNRALVQQKESEKIAQELAKLQVDMVVVFDENAKEKTSEAWARDWANWALNGQSRVAFIIGGPYGLDESILQKYSTRLALSQFTFTHQLARVVLWEQIYRALSIINGKRYHY